MPPARKLSHLIALLLVAILFLPTTLMAAESTYKISLIIFKTPELNQTPPADIYKPYQLELNEHQVSLQGHAPEDPSEQIASHTVLPESEFGLQKELTALQKSEEYEPMVALSWWQSFDGSEANKTVNLLAGNLFDAFGYPFDTSQRYWASTNPEILPTIKAQVMGTIHIDLDRYFNIQFKLQMLTPRQQNRINLPNLLSFTPFTVQQLEQTIRARSNKVYYFDHPGFGAIIKITPYNVKPLKE